MTGWIDNSGMETMQVSLIAKRRVPGIWRPHWVGLALLVSLILPTHGTADQGEYLITDHGAIGNDAFDNAPIINNLISKFGPEGGSILIPEGDFRINSAIVINKNNVTVRGVSYGQRSNIDPAPPGVFPPAGGSVIVLGAGLEHGIAVFAGGAPISGLAVEHLALQGSDGAVYQNGIFIDRTNRWTRIVDVNAINLNKGVFLRNAEGAVVSSCWLAECEAPLHFDTGRDCIVAACSLGGQPGGVSCDVHGHERFVFTGNTVFPDGYTGLFMTETHSSSVTHNTFTGWYTGVVVVEGNMNSLTDNAISGVLQGGGWPADPKGRDGLYGLIRIVGNDNVFASSSVISWQPDNDARVHVVSGNRNVLRSIYIGAHSSPRRIRIGSAAADTLITHSGYASETEILGSGTRVTYDP